jgi:hypothetical protein
MTEDEHQKAEKHLRDFRSVIGAAGTAGKMASILGYEDFERDIVRLILKHRKAYEDGALPPNRRVGLSDEST